MAVRRADQAETKTASGVSGSSSAQSRTKKAFVRFDDYLDLNEENMRRSCKRLMNHLYSETSGPSQVAGSAAPTAISGQAPNKCPPAAAGAPNNTSNKSAVTGGANRAKCISFADNKKSLAQPSHSPATTTTTTAPANTNGKSYLRSQYERRQQRQLELMSKMQLEPEGTDIADGANARQSQPKQQLQVQKHEVTQQHKKQEEQQRRRQMQQQDLVAKSHELSKRRFFEKLERRESIKNLNSGAQLNEQQQPISSAAQVAALTAAADAQSDAVALQGPQIGRLANIQIGAGQKSLDDNELMLKAYQSLVSKSKSANETNASDKNDELVGDDGIGKRSHPNMETLGQSDGAVDCGTKELAVELIGFYTPSPRSSADCRAATATTTTEQLIEFSVKEQQEQQVDEKFSSKLVAQQLVEQQLSTAALAFIPASEDESAFEISVPSDGSGILSNSSSLNQPDGFISSGLLLVKKVEVANESQSLIDLPPLTQASAPANAVEFDDRPPTLSGRQKSALSTQQVANKTKAPLDDLTDNKVKQIDGQRPTTIAGTMASVVGTNRDGCECISEATFSEPESNLPGIDDDNRQKRAAASVSLTISGGNNHNSSNDDNNGMVNTISSVDGATSNEQDGSNDCCGGSVERFQIDLASEQTATIEVGGESNRVRDHEAPEALRLVEQPGGAASTTAAAAFSRIPTLVGSSFSAYPVQTESAAQEQHLAASLQTITKHRIRDVPPEANCGINRKEAIVSEMATSAEASNYDDAAIEKVDAEQQVNEVDKEHGSFEGLAHTNEDVYANSTSYDGKNNGNHVVKGVRNILESDETDGIELMKGKLIESEYTAGHHANLVIQKQLRRNHSTEEDGGSSCSSSGFGASISDGANSIGDTVISMSDNKQHNAENEYRRPTSLAVMSLRGDREEQDHDSNPIYDSICQPKSRICNQALPGSGKLAAYQQLVGPDQAYPKGRSLLVENHNYAFVLNSCHSSQPDSSIVPERDGLATEGYANLPLRNKALAVEYAFARCPTSDNINRNDNEKLPNNLHFDADSSGCSYSTTSANSGGFSMLPPARVECPLPTNNLESLDSFASGSSPKKSSLLRKFGSLVSRAFTGGVGAGTGVQSATSASKINEHDDELEQPQVTCNNANGIGPRTALVIERDHKGELAGASCQAQVGEADLVILQTKHVNQRKQQPMLSSAKQQGEQNSALCHRHDDRLSRGKKHSRKMRRSNSASDVDSESSVSCSSRSSLDIRQRRNGHPKKADSVFEELESLVSPSKNSTYYRAADEDPLDSNKTRCRAQSSSHRRHHKQQLTSTCHHIDIDCISLTKALVVGAKEANAENQNTWGTNANKSVGGPRSLLRLFNPISSQKAAESTPNLAASIQTCRPSSRCDLAGDKDSLNQPTSGFWGFSSLIGPSHATQADTIKTKHRGRKQHQKGSRTDAQQSLDYGDHESLVYSNLQSLNAGYKVQLPSRGKEEQQQHLLDKYQSLSLYQNLLQTYAKRRHHGVHHGHHCHHHHHHNHRRAHHTISTSRHTHRSSTRCAQSCGQSCRVSSSASSEGPVSGHRAVVSGQLIKINKSDGSQVVELQRSPGKSWGFFVARGAINNVKGKAMVWLTSATNWLVF